jgi:translation initiation factor IF-1
MAKEEAIEMTGKIVDILPNAMFKVQVENWERPIVAYLNGRMKQHNIKVLLGDSVLLEFSPYDLTKGRIIRRL